MGISLTVRGSGGTPLIQSARHMADRVAKENLFAEFQADLRAFKPLADAVLSWKSRADIDEKVLEKVLKAIVFQKLPVVGPGTAMNEWLLGQQAIPKLNALQKLQRRLHEALFTMEEDPTPVVEAMRDFVQNINEVVKGVAPERFTYAGFTVLNPDRLLEERAMHILEGVAYLVALFKKRGVEPLLRDTVKQIVLDMGLREEGFAGVYVPQYRQINLSTILTSEQPAKMMSNWVQEVALHEMGHHLHLSFLHPRAREEWDAGWVEVEQARAKLEAQFSVTPTDRWRFWGLIERSGWEPKQVGAKLKGLDRAKFLVWLNKTEGNQVSSSFKQVRLTDYGKAVMKFFRDPEVKYQEYVQDNSPERAREMVDRLKKTYMSNLELTEWYATRNYPTLDADTVEKIRASDKSVSDALDKLGIPTDYGRKDTMEDFAESFVLFMTEPSRLSETALYRMKRALSLSGLYGRMVMKVASRWVRGPSDESDRKVAARKPKVEKTLKELSLAYRLASKAWEDHFRSTGKWDPKLEKAMDKAHAAYLRAVSRADGEDEDEG